MEVISTILGIEPPIQIELVNVTNAMPEKQSYHDYYDEDLIQSVMKWNSPSFELFPEYDFEGFNPEKSVSLGCRDLRCCRMASMIVLGTTFLS